MTTDRQSSIEVQSSGGIARVWMDRPERHNAFDRAMLVESIAAVEALVPDESVAAVILAGRGPSFCTGVDVKDLAANTLGREWFADWQRLISALERLPMPLIAAIHGHCLGGGLMLTLACDYRVAADDVRMGLAAVRHGIIPGSATYRLAEVTGAATARRLCLFAEYVDAAEALRLNLIDKVVPRPDLMATAEALAERVSGFSATAVRETKRLVVSAASAPTSDIEADYLTAQARCLDALADQG